MTVQDDIPYRDFTHREFRPDHKPEPPTPKGVPLSFPGSTLTPQKAGSMLCKVAAKVRSAPNGRPMKGAAPKSGGKAITIKK